MKQKINIEEIMLKIIINQYKSQPHMEEEQAGIHKTRDFICACGKNYLSYAALFTHIKQKHDGKAPGPIVRPRSQRKRGRPRKNPLNDQDLKNSDSDAPKNGISIANEINNNIYIYQKKAKKAAELLGCGQFQAFQAYRPQFASTNKQKNDKEGLKRLGLKKCVSGTQRGFQKVRREESSSSCEAPKSLNHCRSAPAQNEKVGNDNCSYEYKYVIKHLLSMFQDYQPTQQEYSCRQILQIFDIMNQQSQDGSSISKKKYEKLSIQKGFKIFLKQIKNQLQQFEHKQVSFLLSLFYEYISQKIGKPANTMQLGLEMSQFTKYVTSFLYQYLPAKVNQLCIGCLHIFKNLNTTNIMMCLCNWISIREMEESIKNRPLKMVYQQKQEQKVTKSQISRNQAQLYRQTFSEKGKQKQSKSVESQSQQQIEFQQINAVLQMAKSIKNRATADPDNYDHNNDEKDDDNDEAEDSQSSESEEEDIIEEQSLQEKDIKNSNKINYLTVLK